MIMKNILHCTRGYLFCLLFMASLHQVRGQTIVYVTPGTGITLAPGSNLTVDLLTLTPSSAFTMNGVTVTKNTTITHPAFNTYISRVYAFSSTTASFSGDVQFGYTDGAELNGLPEASLQLNIYDGAHWQSFAANTNNTVSNYVLTNSLSNVTLNELTLASASAPLPLRWGTVRAYRENGQLFIAWETLQENNVGFFNIEKSSDGRSWSTIIRNVPARDLALPQQYRESDPAYSPDMIFYRIKEVDLDGHFSYSSVVVVSPENTRNAFVLFPNPVENRFFISGDNLAGLKQVQLFSSSGVLLKTWEGPQGSYPVDLPAAGVYYVRLQKTDGSVQYEKLIKK